MSHKKTKRINDYTIDLDYDHKIVWYKHTGVLTHEDIGHVWENELLTRKEFTEQGFNLFSDYSDARFDIELDFLPVLMGFMKSIEHIVKGKKQCLIVSDPFSTASSVLFENKINEEIGFEVKVFNTEQAALDWLIG